MFKWPVRKCYYVAKVCAVLALALVVLALVEQWRGGRRTARAARAPAAAEPEEAEYERQVAADEARIVPGLGAGGAAARLLGEGQRRGEESLKKLAMNVYLSDRIAYNRTLNDYRHPACASQKYDAELPSASVVVVFHNEPYSVVVRTVWSVLGGARRDQPWHRHANYVDRATGRTMTLGYPGQDPASPFVYLKEIILVDDNSTLPELKGKLSHYVRTRLPPGLIRILRLPDRVGLTRARLAGSRYARGAVLAFLDAHCEAQRDWLRPLLQRVKDSPTAVVVPIIDVIEQKDFYYSVVDQNVFQVGGFSFGGHFTWIDVPEREKARRGSDIAPTWSPTMAGGLFAISRKYFWELGAYDEQMAGWGGENLEMSFRIWQCGGTLETVPCSRVGHVFRAFHPYGMPADTDTHGINTARMAEVWMDEYAELFYLHRPDLRNNPKIGDVTHRRVLREKLQCKSFQWYLDTVYPEKFVPVRDAFGYGRFKNPASGLCLDSLQREAEGAALGVYPCHARLTTSQYLTLARSGELRDEERCAELQFLRRRADKAPPEEARPLLMVGCRPNRKNQSWRYLPTKQLQHVSSGLCLDAGFESGRDARARACRRAAPSQRWDIDYSEDNDFQDGEEGGSPERGARLRRLRGQQRKNDEGRSNRVMRSLQAYREAPDAPDARTDAPVARRRAGHRKKRHRSKKHGKVKRSRTKTKNKFILRLERAGPGHDGRDEHLEVDVHCAHRRLFPNNSFVRDLVAILNDNNIKVINNGRVFERNRVTEQRAARHREAKVLEKLDVAEQRAGPPAGAAPPAADPAPAPGPAPAAPATPPAPPPMHVTRRWRVRKPAPGAAPAEPAGAVRAGDGGGGPDEKRIIIEDFVEVRPAPAADAPHQRVRKRRRKHMRVSPSPLVVAPEVAGGAGDDPDHLVMTLLNSRLAPEPRARTQGSRDSEEGSMKMENSVVGSGPPGATRAPPAGDSLEEVPMVGSAEAGGSKRDGYSLDSELEGPGGTPPRARAADWHLETGAEAAPDAPHAPDAPDAPPRPGARAPRPPAPRARASDTDGENLVLDEAARGAARGGGGGGAAPLKVVMRSNLTFNLGDEFFNWRARDDVASLLGELSAGPSNATRGAPPAHAWLRAAGDAVSTGRGVLRAPAPAPAPAPASSSAVEDSSSASDSGSNET